MKDKEIEELLKVLGLKQESFYNQVVSDFPEVNNPSYVTTTATTSNYKYFGCDPQSKEFNFDDVVDARLRKTRELLLHKGKEYIRDDNPFHNFDRGAEMLRCTPERYLINLVSKQIISLLDMINDIDKGIMPTEAMIDEKTGDVGVYNILLEGLLKRRLNS